MLYLQSFIRSPGRAPSMRPFKPQTLSDKTNAPSFRPRAKLDSTKKGLGLRGSGNGNKAAPTVALTPASTSSPDAVPQSFVPFPSSDEDGESEAEEEYDVKAPSASMSSASYSENGLKRPLSAEGRRKRCQVPPADSSHGAAPRRRSTAALMRPASTASSASASPSPKRPKKSRRAVADMQFAADVHRSILRSMSLRDDAAAVTMAVDGPADVLREQDRALADRLSKSLRELGCSPALIEGCAHTASPSVEVTKTQFEGGAGTGVEVGVEVGSVPCEDDVVMHAVDAAGRAPDAPLASPPHGPCTPASSSTSSSTSTSPPPSPQSPVRTRSPSPPASTATPVPGARVYEMPQLVAALYMRRHDRAAKTRATPPAERVRVRTSSPLASSIAVTAASD